MRPLRKPATHLGILNDQVAWGKDESNKRGREEHLDDGNVSIVAAEDLGEWIRVKDAKTFRGAWKARNILAKREDVEDAHAGFKAGR